ncbi:MAG: DUF4180 domain-containing protein [Clostridiales bacterium]|nr:DUF4180 domain-containing protein [Clostridiales bacterium]
MMKNKVMEIKRTQIQDFIYESNNGKDFFFVATKEEAIQMLKDAQ